MSSWNTQYPVVGSGPHAWHGRTTSSLQWNRTACPPASSAPAHIASSSRSTLLPRTGLPLSATSVRLDPVIGPLLRSPPGRPHQRGGSDTVEERDALHRRLERARRRQKRIGQRLRH